MKVITLVLGGLQVNTYFYYDEKHMEGVVIDPGDDMRVIQFIEKNNLKLAAVLLTHGHFDHIEGISLLRKHSDAPVMIHADETPIISDPSLNGSNAMSVRPRAVTPDAQLTDGQTIKFRGTELAVIHTPGHSPGGVCFYDAKRKILFSGDTLFQESVGRSDFTFGDGKLLEQSIINKLFVLPDEVVVYPGHGQPTTIKHEKAHNPFINL